MTWVLWPCIAPHRTSPIHLRKVGFYKIPNNMSDFSRRLIRKSRQVIVSCDSETVSKYFVWKVDQKLPNFVLNLRFGKTVYHTLNG